jgi:hypothetical protein
VLTFKACANCKGRVPDSVRRCPHCGLDPHSLVKHTVIPPAPPTQVVQTAPPIQAVPVYIVQPPPPKGRTWQIISSIIGALIGLWAVNSALECSQPHGHDDTIVLHAAEEATKEQFGDGIHFPSLSDVKVVNTGDKNYDISGIFTTKYERLLHFSVHVEILPQEGNLEKWAYSNYQAWE